MLTLADLFLIFGIPVEAVLLILLAWRKTYRTLPGQTHMINAKVLVPELVKFFS